MKTVNDGFTLIEVLLSLVLVTILIGLALPVYYSLFSRNDLDLARNQAVQSLRRAAFLSSPSDGDSVWGFKAQPLSITVFKGLSYVARDANYDEIYQIADSINPSGSTEFVFNKMTGFPQSTGSLTLISTNGETRTITINSKGQVSY